ncbi:hypothetical protein CP8484711_0350, partial [Chlamydia psittaci 84-8471/1]
MRSIASGKRS